MIFRIYCLNLPNLSFYHLVRHAIFKSLLFICSGIIIHIINFQDIRMFGKLSSLIPFTIVMFNISRFSLCGMYFYSGFYSKDIILESMIIYNINYWVFLLIYFCTILTLIYTFRILYYSIVVEFIFTSLYIIEEDNLFIKSIFIIIILSIIGGSVVNYIIFDKLEIIHVILLY